MTFLPSGLLREIYLLLSSWCYCVCLWWIRHVHRICGR